MKYGDDYPAQDRFIQRWRDNNPAVPRFEIQRALPTDGVWKPHPSEQYPADYGGAASESDDPVSLLDTVDMLTRSYRDVGYHDSFRVIDRAVYRNEVTALDAAVYWRANFDRLAGLAGHRWPYADELRPV